ncbi:hypothetical protein BGZ72_009128 [Mortierella alpina]|nr:hypothetical protein BGZ72_009128 [Mortierella alpina]
MKVGQCTFHSIPALIRILINTRDPTITMEDRITSRCRQTWPYRALRILRVPSHLIDEDRIYRGNGRCWRVWRRPRRQAGTSVNIATSGSADRAPYASTRIRIRASGRSNAVKKDADGSSRCKATCVAICACIEWAV